MLKYVFILGVSNKISVLHLSHLLSLSLSRTHTHSHTNAYKIISASKNSCTFKCMNLWDEHQVFAVQPTSYRIMIKNMTVYTCLFIFALGNLYSILTF
jgi:hypothetical protein